MPVSEVSCEHPMEHHEIPLTPSWDEMDHVTKLERLRDLSDREILEQYKPQDETEQDFLRRVRRDRDYWHPHMLGTPRSAGDAPNKETVIGAWRDLNRAEALLELIDNSIDAWRRRKDRYPTAVAPQLLIYIDLNRPAGILTYEDNAGGVKESDLLNLVIPGYSETEEMEATIGSYRTGGKKAVFKLATEANIKTWYWSPVGTVDEAFEVHLDHNWLQNPTEYKFPVYPLENRSDIDRGQTFYSLRLRGKEWSVEATAEITREIRKTYTLLMVRNPEIKIHFLNREAPLQPLDDMYRFTTAHTETLDLRAQAVTFGTSLEWRGRQHEVEIEVVLGCRTTTASTRGEDAWGIDLYGNDRLFVYHDQDEILRWYEAPTSGARTLIRGFINIHGPNVFVPWDTHKRHLNSDREIIQILRTHAQIKNLFTEWSRAYRAAGSLPELSSRIRGVAAPWRAKGRGGKRDVNVAFRQEVQLSPKLTGTGVKLPKAVHRP